MVLYYHVTGEQRKALVAAVNAFVDAPAVYQNAPTLRLRHRRVQRRQGRYADRLGEQGADDSAAGEGVHG